MRQVSEEIRLPHRIRNDDIFIKISVEIVFFDEGDLPLRADESALCETKRNETKRKETKRRESKRNEPSKIVT